MKRIYLACVGYMMSLAILWAQNCNQPMSNFQFQQQKNNINAQSNDAQRLMLSKQLLENNCVSSTQVKEICELLSNDYSKLDFAKSAYLRLTDRPNFYEVYNSFSYFSTAFMLHDFVMEQRGGAPTTGGGTNGNPTDNTLTFPNLNYPNHIGYTGAKKCEYPLAENGFMPLALDVKRLSNENDRVNKLDQITNNYCMTTSQIMRFATLLTEDANRLSFLKKAYAKVFDVTNYGQAAQTLQYAQSQNNFVTFLGSTGGTPTVDASCTVSAADMADMKQRLQRESFENSKLNTAKIIVKSKKCFTSTQVKDVVTWFIYSDSKLNIAKYMWDFTTDRDNFYMVADGFTYQQDKDQLMKFIQSKK